MMQHQGGMDPKKPMLNDDRTVERGHPHHEAALFDQRFRQQIQDSLNDPRPNLPHAQVQEAMRAKKAGLQKSISKALREDPSAPTP